MVDIGVSAVKLCWLAWCLVIAYSDWRTRRIPNWALAVALVPAVLALVINDAGLLGASRQESLVGAVLGFAFFFPGYLLGSSGAGDVKLSAICGLLLGTQQMLVAISVVSALLIGSACFFTYRLGWSEARRLRFPAGIAIVSGFGVTILFPQIAFPWQDF